MYNTLDNFIVVLFVTVLLHMVHVQTISSIEIVKVTYELFDI